MNDAEEFDELAKRQGDWGGGYQAKKAMAANKLQEPPSEWAGIKAILDEYGLQAIDFVADFKAALAQPAQEPDLTEQGRKRSAILGNNVECMMDVGLPFLKALETTLKVYDHPAPPKREWVELTQKEVQEIHDTYYKRMGPQEFAKAIEQALKEKNNGT